MSNESGKTVALQTPLSNLKKRFGDGAIMKLGEAPHLEKASETAQTEDANPIVEQA